MGTHENLLKLVNIGKSFGNIVALKDINFEIGNNEIIGLLGDNGAGKSTLIKIITGVYKPDVGEMFWKGEKLKGYSATKAREIGIQTVFQDRALAEQHSLWRNIFMGHEISGRFGFINIKKQKEETKKLMTEIMGFTSSAVTPDAIVGKMSGGERQGVAISRALYFNADLVILDEPTTGLSLKETKRVLEFIEGIKERHKSCIFISHNIYHVYPIVDRIVVVDRGKIVGSFNKCDISLEELVEKLYLVAESGKMCGASEAYMP
ncbi:MAG: ATP-binding cassette domain-containing protein [Bacillota bacterium]